jgi:hypothetical protein
MPRYAKNLLTVMATIVVMLLLIETFFYFFPRLLPPDVLMNLSRGRVDMAFGNDPAQLVEHLSSPPWVKFRPDVTVHDGVRPNEVSSFNSVWKTDSNGFKNPPGQTLDGARLVIVGNSHIEGIGVRPQDTIAGVLTGTYHIPAYNLGVEGYGPQQSVAAFERWGTGPSVRYAVYAFNGSLHFDAAAGDRGDPQGRINARARDEDRRSANTILNNSVLVALLRTSYRRLRDRYGSDVLREVPEGDVVPRAEALRFIKAEMANDVKMPSKPRNPETDPDMKVNDAEVLSFAQDAQRCGIEPIVLIMPSARVQTHIAYPDKLPAAWSGSLGQAEEAANAHVLAFAKQNGIAVVDARPTIRAALARWAAGTGNGTLDFRMAPFFKLDGHPTRIGQAIYAKALADYIDGQRLPDKAVTCRRDEDAPSP